MAGLLLTAGVCQHAAACIGAELCVVLPCLATPVVHTAVWRAQWVTLGGVLLQDLLAPSPGTLCLRSAALCLWLGETQTPSHPLMAPSAGEWHGQMLLRYSSSSGAGALGEQCVCFTRLSTGCVRRLGRVNEACILRAYLGVVLCTQECACFIKCCKHVLLLFCCCRYFQDLNGSRSDTQFAVLEGVGHCPQDDRPELLHQQLLPWLEQRWT